MIRKVEAYIQKMHMIQPGDRVCVGLSGGADSVCLFLILCTLSESMGFSLRAIHVEHGIRGEESQKDAEFVQRLCEERKAPLTLVSVDVPAYAKEQGLGLEEAARIKRYEAFLKNTKPGDKVALAHHMDDEAETVLFQMVRGSGITGLSGMAPVRSEGERTFIRPLLCVSREEIEHFLQKESRDYRTDATNADIAYSRNRIRKKVMPELRQVNEQAVPHICHMADSLRELEEYLSTEVHKWVKKAVRLEDGAGISLTVLEEAPSIIQKELLLWTMEAVCGKRRDLCRVHVQSLLELMDLQSGKRVDLPYGMCAVKEYDVLRIFQVEEAVEDYEETLFFSGENDAVEILLPHQEGSLTFSIEKFDGNCGKIPKNSCTKWFNYDKIKDTIAVRNRREKDYFTIDEMGHRKKLKEYFIEQKVPVSKRGTVPLVAVGSEILWMPGGRTSENYRVYEDTEYILIITYHGGIKHD